ncbi:MAG TPA: thioredoxin-disulfide reductase [Bacilli bacterium]|jgi:thioredoxin reductase (NADPH)|nr:MAG: Thioredoxin reductase [Tenericutes bacterium ADurb.Bin140]HOE77220.1 thioredoxin-disulfide reductase [Bacilli bacterium]HON63614.1 thioredoxin-disulfide reductase [Bacilli bacterium]HOR95776.1 thioredoxin-disulfide reductase [Bacilli bacterium]HPD11991.1 thioredoxin-disulfide reductase [Bacilli bacterium]
MYDVLVIGGGPAGMTAAIYLKRANLNVAFIEKGAPGGKMTETYLIENYPGFPSINGADLALAMYQQTLNLNIPHLYGEVKSVEKTPEGFTVKTEFEEFQAQKIIVATGTVSRKLHIPGEDQFLGKGISFCAVCDGSLYKDKTVAVIGGGNSAFEESIYLSRLVQHVHIIVRSSRFRAEEALIKKVEAVPNITIHKENETLAFLGNASLEKIRLLDKTERKEWELPVDGAFIYIGFDPATQFLNNLGVLDQDGYIVVDENYETKVKGLYGAGDCLPKKTRQIVTATGDGASAASALVRSYR